MHITKQWLYAALNRAIRTVCQTAIATIGVATVLDDVNWWMVASSSILSGVISILTSLSGLPEVSSSEEDSAK